MTFPGLHPEVTGQAQGGEALFHQPAVLRHPSAAHRPGVGRSSPTDAGPKEWLAELLSPLHSRPVLGSHTRSLRTGTALRRSIRDRIGGVALISPISCSNGPSPSAGTTSIPAAFNASVRIRTSKSSRPTELVSGAPTSHRRRPRSDRPSDARRPRPRRCPPRVTTPTSATQRGSQPGDQEFADQP